MHRSKFVLPCLLLILVSAGCSSTPDENSNAPKASPSATPTPDLGVGLPSLKMNEPDRFAATLRVTAQSAEEQTEQAEFELALLRRGSDRRWTLSPETATEIWYLEKSGVMNYVVVPGRKLYAEVPVDVFGPKLNDWATPIGLVRRLLSSSRFEKLGSETVDGRTAFKFLSAPDNAETTQSSLIYIDEETGVPLRASMNISVGKSKVSIASETRNIRQYADPSQFDVPIGFKKVPAEQIKAQIEVFASKLRAVVDKARLDRNGAPTAGTVSSSGTPASNQTDSTNRPSSRNPEPSGPSSRPGGPAAIAKPGN